MQEQQSQREQPNQQRLESIHKNMQGLIAKSVPEFEKALPSHMTAARFSRIALTCFRTTPLLWECDPLSFLGALVVTSQLGLEPGNHLGHVYLIPFRNKNKGIIEVQVIIGYRGMIDLARRSGQILSITAQCVYEKDHFEFELGLDEKLVHKPSTGDRGALRYAYAVAKLHGGGHQFEVLTVDDIEKAKRSSKNPNLVWKDWYSEMARKTAIRRLFKYLPVSIEMANSMQLDHLADEGRSQGNKALLDASYIIEHETGTTETIKDINKKEETIVADKQRDELLLKIDERWAQVRSMRSEHELLALLNIKSYADIEKETTASLDAILEVLIDVKV